MMTIIKNSEQKCWDEINHKELADKSLNLIHKIAITEPDSKRMCELIVGGCRKFLIDEGFWKDE